MKHELPALPFAKNSLEPYMSAETIEYHYGKHHKGYVDKLNQLIPGTEFENSSLIEIIKKATGPIFNNGAQVWNHTFFWNCLSPEKIQPGSKIISKIEQSFQSIESFEQKFKEAAMKHFGSGYAWLLMDSQGHLSIETTANAENPIRAGKKPLLTCDLWEHAYYIDYRNERAKFLDGFWTILNWRFIEANLDAREVLAA